MAVIACCEAMQGCLSSSRLLTILTRCHSAPQWRGGSHSALGYLCHLTRMYSAGDEQGLALVGLC